MKLAEWSTCDGCGRTVERLVCFRYNKFNGFVELCAECIRVAGVILARAEKDAAKDDVPSPEGERK